MTNNNWQLEFSTILKDNSCPLSQEDMRAFTSDLVGQGYQENSDNELILDSCSHYDAVFGKQKWLSASLDAMILLFPSALSMVPTGWHLPSPQGRPSWHTQ